MVKERRNIGATSTRDREDRRRGVGWLWWLLLAAGIAALAIFLVLRNAGDEGDDAGIDVTDEQSSGVNEDDDVGEGADATGDELTDGGDGTEGDGEDAQGSDQSGSSGSDDDDSASGGGQSGSGADSPLTSEGEALLPVPEAGLAAYADLPAEARSVPVQSVVADEGFWVGTSETDRVFVFFAADNAGNESPVQVEAGRPISFTGTVKALPSDFATAFGVDASEGADQLGQQGHYIEVAPNAIQQG